MVILVIFENLCFTW